MVDAPLDPRMLVREFAKIMEKAGEHDLAASMLEQIDSPTLHILLMQHTLRLTALAEEILNAEEPPC